MKAMAQATWKAGEPLTLVEVPVADPKRGQVRVAVKAIGVNPVDWKMRSGGPFRLAARILNAIHGVPLPVILGVDFAGVVDAVGEGVTSVRVGQRVFGGTNFSKGERGSYAEFVVVGQDRVAPIPESVSFEVAGALPVAGVTALMALTEVGHLPQNGRALVLGASGGVGQFAVQLAKHTLGGSVVVGVCSTGNVALVRGLGADAVVDYKMARTLRAAPSAAAGAAGLDRHAAPAERRLDQTAVSASRPSASSAAQPRRVGDVFEQTKPHGPFDVIVDCAGGYSGAGCRAQLAPGGRHVMIAGDSLAAVVQILVPPFTSRSIIGVANRARLERLVGAVAQGQVKVTIARTFKLEEVDAAHRLSQTGRTTGKIILVP